MANYAIQSAPEFLNFPLEKQDRYRARIKFEPIRMEEVTFIGKDKAKAQLSYSWEEVRDLGARISSGLVGFLGDAIFGDDNATDEQKKVIDAERNRASVIREGIVTGSKDLVRSQPIVRTRKYCYLYMPTGIQFNDQVNVKNANIGLTGAAAMSAARNLGLPSDIGAAGSLLATTFGTALSTVFDVADNPAAFAAIAAKTAQTLDFANLVGGENIAAGIQLASQVVANPVTRAIFDNVPLRIFTFQFKFIPLSPRESEEIEKIIYYFRSEMFPEALTFTTSGLPFGFKFPSMFDVRLQYGMSNNAGTSTYRVLPNTDILPCYLINIQHNYNPSAMSFHKGGKPTEVDMSLTFMEYRPLVKQDIEDFGKKGNVGPYKIEDGEEIISFIPQQNRVEE